MRLVVLSEEQRWAVLEKCYNNPGTGNHGGMRATMDRVVVGSYWDNIKADVADWVKEPWEVVGMDLIGPLKNNMKDHQFVLTVTDLFTKWVISEPLKCGSSTETAEALVSKLYTFGMVQKIITDRGRAFVNKLNAHIFVALNIKHAIKSAYHPQSNGQVRKNIEKAGDEVLIGELKKKVRKGNCLQDLHQGPFTITSLTEKGVASVAMLGKKQKVNVAQLRPYFRPQDHSHTEGSQVDYQYANKGPLWSKRLCPQQESGLRRIERAVSGHTPAHPTSPLSPAGVLRSPSPPLRRPDHQHPHRSLRSQQRRPDDRHLQRAQVSVTHTYCRCLCCRSRRTGSLTSFASLPHRGYFGSVVNSPRTVPGCLASVPSPFRWVLRTIRLGYEIQLPAHPQNSRAFISL
nr:uncharacterized protein LOC129454568 [Misgurnus anguillicaudatus]